MQKTSTYLSIILLFHFGNNVLGQESFYLAYDFGYHQQVPFKLVVKDDNIYTIGTSLLRNAIGDERTLFIAKFSSSGKYLQHKVLEDDDAVWVFSNVCRDVVELENELFSADTNLLGGSNFVSFGQISGYNVEHDTFRVVHRVEPEMPGEAAKTITTLFKTPSSKLGFTLLEREEDDKGIFLNVVDHNGSNEQEFVHKVENHQYIIRETLVSEDHYLLLGYLRIRDTDERLIFCAKISHELDLLELRTYSDFSYLGEEFSAHYDSEGNVFIAAHHLKNQPEHLAPITLKLDSNLDVLWQRELKVDEFVRGTNIYYDCIKSHSDNGSIIIGSGRIGTNTFPTIAKISNEGDSLFHFRLENLDGQFLGELQKVEVSEDGNYLATGFWFPENTADSIFVKGLLMKFDDDGNICPREKLSYSKELNGLKLRMYPNPVSEILYIQSPEPLESVFVSDMNGRIITRRSEVTAGTILFLPVEGYTAGKYNLHYKIKGGEYQSSSFVVVD